MTRPPAAAALVGGWEIACNWTGLPFSWTPLEPMQTAGMRPNEIIIIAADDARLRSNRSRQLVVLRRGKRAIGRDLELILDQMFGLR